MCEKGRFLDSRKVFFHYLFVFEGRGVFLRKEEAFSLREKEEDSVEKVKKCIFLRCASRDVFLQSRGQRRFIETRKRGFLERRKGRFLWEESHPAVYVRRAKYETLVPPRPPSSL